MTGEPPWKADFEIDEATARACIEGQWPHLAPVRLQLFGEGWDNRVFLVNGTMLFRFPRRKISVPLLEREREVLPNLVPLLPLAIPKPIYLGRPGRGFPWPFFGYEALPGKTACRARLDDAARSAMAPVLGSFLAQLHRNSHLGKSLGIGGDPFHRCDLPILTDKIETRLKELHGQWSPNRPKAIRSLLRKPLPFQPRTDVLIHGDLYVRHLLVDERHGLTGVIDWGDLHMGDPAVDLAIGWSLLPRSAHHAFRQAYGPIGDTTWGMARIRGLFHGVVLYHYGLKKEDGDLVREARFILDQVLA